MKTITKKDLVDRIADKTGNKRVVVKKIVQYFLDEIVNELGEGNRLEFRDFGVFEIRERAARVAQNPKTMEKVYVPEKRTVKFKIGRLMKQKLFERNGDDRGQRAHTLRPKRHTAPAPTPRASLSAPSERRSAHTSRKKNDQVLSRDGRSFFFFSTDGALLARALLLPTNRRSIICSTPPLR
jgi:integration host factor subunit beta